MSFSSRPFHASVYVSKVCVLLRLAAVAVLSSFVLFIFGCGSTRPRGERDDATVEEDSTQDFMDGEVENDAVIESDSAVGPEEDAAETDLWVEILAPADGTEVENPVTVSFNTGEGVRWVTIEADEWPLHDGMLSADLGSHTYSFTGTGFERQVVVDGYDAQEDWVASDEVWFTVSAPDFVFPIEDEPGLILSHFDDPSSSAAFGAARSGGRVHAGCDLYWTDDGGLHYGTSYYYLNNHTPIYAVTDGVIVGYAPFYMGTHALVVDHGDFTIRYGEVDSGGLAGSLTVGSQVSAGEHIAYMGDLNMSSGTWAMLHFELYSNDLTGPLTDTSNYVYMNVPDANYQRRGDLMDCGPFLRALLD